MEQFEEEKHRQMNLMERSIRGLKGNIELTTLVTANKVQGHLKDNKNLLFEVNCMRQEVRTLALENQHLKAELENHKLLEKRQATANQPNQYSQFNKQSNAKKSGVKAKEHLEPDRYFGDDFEDDANDAGVTGNHNVASSMGRPGGMITSQSTPLLMNYNQFSQQNPNSNNSIDTKPPLQTIEMTDSTSGVVSALGSTAVSRQLSTNNVQSKLSRQSSAGCPGIDEECDGINYGLNPTPTYASVHTPGSTLDKPLTAPFIPSLATIPSPVPNMSNEGSIINSIGNEAHPANNYVGMQDEISVTNSDIGGGGSVDGMVRLRTNSTSLSYNQNSNNNIAVKVHEVKRSKSLGKDNDNPKKNSGNKSDNKYDSKLDDIMRENMMEIQRGQSKVSNNDTAEDILRKYASKYGDQDSVNTNLRSTLNAKSGAVGMDNKSSGALKNVATKPLSINDSVKFPVINNYSDTPSYISASFGNTVNPGPRPLGWKRNNHV